MARTRIRKAWLRRFGAKLRDRIRARRRGELGPLLLIPGTGGTKLLKNGKSLGHPKVLDFKIYLMKTIGQDVSEIVRDLSMEHRRGQISAVRTTLAANSEVTPGDVLEVAYNQILPHSDVAFEYDWRADIECSAERLLEKLLSRDSNAEPWRIVAHSQGGLVAVVASKLFAKRFPRRRFSSLVSHIVFGGVPLYGTLNSAHAILVGEDLGERASEEFKKIAATWPAIYQMLPDWYAVRTPAGDYSRRSLFHAETYVRYPWVSPDLLARAWELRASYLRNPLSAMQGTKVSILMTTRQRTWDRIVLDDEGVLHFGKATADGDSLVPDQITRRRMSDIERKCVHLVGKNENVPEHSFLFTDDWFTQLALRELEK